MPRTAHPEPKSIPPARRLLGLRPETPFRGGRAVDGPLLPETAGLLDGFAGASSPEAIEALTQRDSDRVACYRAVPTANLPFLRFHVAEADATLLAFAGKGTPGFEVLEVFRAGFQFHWRRDLVRCHDEQLPLIGRLCGLSEARELAVEHIALPILRKGRVREIRGWLVFSHSPGPVEGASHTEEVTMFRRIEKSRPLRLPPGLSRPDRDEGTARSMLRSLKERWRPAGSRRRSR